MLLNIINEARRDFEKHCEDTHQSNSAGCLAFLNKAVTAVQEEDDLTLVVERTFESRKGFKDVSEWLDRRGCSNPREYKRLMIKGFYALTMLEPTEKQRKTLGGLVAAYDKEWPTTGQTPEQKKAQAQKRASKLMATALEAVISTGADKKQAEKIVRALLKAGLLKAA